jgi:hypothetical protein
MLITVWQILRNSFHHFLKICERIMVWVNTSGLVNTLKRVVLIFTALGIGISLVCFIAAIFVLGLISFPLFLLAGRIISALKVPTVYG